MIVCSSPKSSAPIASTTAVAREICRDGEPTGGDVVVVAKTRSSHVRVRAPTSRAANQSETGSSPLPCAATLEGQAETVVRLCGPLVVQIAGRRLESALPSRQGRLVFAYLTLRRGRPAARDELIEALWGDSPPASAEAALTSLLSRLRGVLPNGVLQGRAQLSLELGADAEV